MTESAGYWKQLYHKLEKEFDEVQDQLTLVTTSYSKVIEKYKKQKLKLAQLIEQNKALKASQKAHEENNGLLVSTICGASPTIQQSLFRSSITRKSPETRKKSIQRMFEGLFILGDSKEDPGEVKVLEQYPWNCEAAHSVIGKFAFPQGFRPFFIDFSQSGTELLQLLYPKYSRNENSFVFTMKSEALGTLGYPSITNNDKEVLYGCCVIKHELIGNEADQANMPAYPKCYCLLSYFPCFELHFQVLYSLLSIGKAQSLHDEGVIGLLSRASLRSGSSNMEGEYSLLLEEQKGLLDAYYSENFLNSSNVSINLQTVPPLKIDLPQDLSLLDIEWFCSLMFSVLDLNEFFQILCAAMNERSIVFVSSNLALISSCVLGIQALMKPFKWPHLIAPVLPLSLYEVLEAPVPFLIGIPESPGREMSSNNNWVRLDKPRQSKRLIGIPVAEPKANDLKEYLKISYKKFGRKACYSPSNDQMKAVRRISGEIKKFWNEVIEKIPKKALGRDLRNEDIEYSRKSIVAASDQADSTFLRGMVNTQYFAMAIEEISFN